MRIRVFDGHGFGEARFLGQLVLDLSDCEVEYGAQVTANADADGGGVWHKLLSANLTEKPSHELGSVRIVARARRAESQGGSPF